MTPVRFYLSSPLLEYLCLFFFILADAISGFSKVKSGRPPTMEEWAAEVAVMDGAEGMARDLEEMREARERMIACNLRLVLHISRKMFFSGRSGGLKVGA